MKTYKGVITSLKPNQVFVFGSNTQGRHGKGAALWAVKNAGAIYGQASGRQGNSYAIITKDLTSKDHPSISPANIEAQLLQLFTYTNSNPDTEFLIAYSGTGSNLNGYSSLEMANMFRNIPWGKNVIFEEEFLKLITFLQYSLIQTRRYH